MRRINRHHCISLLALDFSALSFGCDNVTFTHSIGENVPERLSALDGAWQGADLAFHLKSQPHGMVVIGVMYWDEDGDKFRVRELSADVKQLRAAAGRDAGETYVVLSPDETRAKAATTKPSRASATPSRFIFYKMAKPDDADHLKLLPLDEKVLADAVRSGKLTGTVKSVTFGTQVHVTSKAEDVESFLASHPAAFDAEHAITLTRVGRLAPTPDDDDTPQR